MKYYSQQILGNFSFVSRSGFSVLFTEIVFSAKSEFIFGVWNLFPSVSKQPYLSLLVTDPWWWRDHCKDVRLIFALLFDWRIRIESSSRGFCEDLSKRHFFNRMFVTKFQSYHWYLVSQQTAVLKGNARPVSWAPEEIGKTLKKQNPVDVAFKEKHQNYEQLQRQATTVCELITSHFQVKTDLFFSWWKLFLCAHDVNFTFQFTCASKYWRK